MEALKAKEVNRVFRAWVEDWEKECIKDKDAVAEVWLLEKYKGFGFFDPEKKTTYALLWRRTWSGTNLASERALAVVGILWQRVMKTMLNPL